MSIMIKDDFKSIIKDTEAIASKFTSIQKNLGKVKTQLNSAYTGGKDFNTWISESEKSVKKLSENTSKLSKAMDTALTTIISKDEAASPTFKNAFGDLINSKKTVEGLLSDFVSSAWARAMAVVVGTKIINDANNVSSDESKIDDVPASDYSSSENQMTGEFQNVFNSGIKQPRSRACVYTAKANILNRKKMLDTGSAESRISSEQIGKTFDNFKQSDFLEDNPYSREYRHGKTQNYKNTVVEGFDYFFKNESYSGTDSLKKHLDEHPEGVLLYSNSSHYEHGITITDYEILEDGKIQFYVMDPATDNCNRIKIEDSFTFSKFKKKNADDYLKGFTNLIYVQ